MAVLDHVILHVNDTKASVAFFVDVMGFARIREHGIPYGDSFWQARQSIQPQMDAVLTRWRGH